MTQCEGWGGVYLNRVCRLVPQVAILLSAILLGVAIGGILLPQAAMGFTRSHPDSPITYLYIAIGTLAFVALALTILEKAVSRQHRFDQDLLDVFLEHIPDNVFFKDINSRFVRISNSMAKYCGLKSPAQALNKTDADIFSGEHAGRALTDEQEIIRTGQPIIEKEEKETWPDGHETWVLTTKVPLKDRSGGIIGTMGIAHNITDRRQAELRVRHMAMHDSLTGLPNRLLLEEQLAQAVASARRDGTNLAVLLINLDRFKNVNESLGHYIGDRLLEAVAARLIRFTRGTDIVARLGGDEFVVAVSGIGKNEEVEPLAQKLLTTVADPFNIEQHDLQITASVGISQFPDNGEKPEALLQYADAALFDAKKKGRGRFSFFSPALTEATQRQHKLESDLVNACARDEFVVHYQPFVESGSGRITGMEALLRWKHPKFGLISPDQFIPQLEELGLMIEAGRWVLRTACRQAVEWTRQGLPEIRMAVNVSSQQFYEGNIVDTVEWVLRETELNPAQLELELTESRILDDSEGTISIMRRLRQIGVSLSLDDFGTGWSSLSYLRQFPLDRIKIDRSFVRDLTTQPIAVAMVKSILGIARDLGFSSIAEGVETSQQMDLLKKLNCPEMQGYFFSRPLPSVDATALLCSATFETKARSAKGSIRNDQLIRGDRDREHLVFPC